MIKPRPPLAQTFATARDENLHAARRNFEYVYQNGGYSLEDLAVIFRQTMPAIKWGKSEVRRFLYPNLVEKNKVTAHSATSQEITEFLQASIKLRDTVQTELAKANTQSEEARVRWGKMMDTPPLRADVVNCIRENLFYVHQNGGYTFEALTAFLQKSCPEYAWDKSKARRFLIPDDSDSKRDVNIPYASVESLGKLLTMSIDLREKVMLTLATMLPRPPSEDGPQ